jgi:hypothetical protein
MAQQESAMLKATKEAKVVTFKVNPEQFHKLQEVAQRQTITVSALLRLLVDSMSDSYVQVMLELEHRRDETGRYAIGAPLYEFSKVRKVRIRNYVPQQLRKVGDEA